MVVVLYDDGDEEWLNLQRERHEVLSGTPGSSLQPAAVPNDDISVSESSGSDDSGSEYQQTDDASDEDMDGETELDSDSQDLEPEDSDGSLGNKRKRAGAVPRAQKKTKKAASSGKKIGDC